MTSPSSHTGGLRSESVSSLVHRLLEEPELPAIIRALDARVFGGIIKRIGLEDTGAVIEFATPRQLEQLFDMDVWSASRPGEEERFDADRFTLWLEILMESDPSTAVKKIAALDETFLSMAFSKLFRVLDTDRLQQGFDALQEDDDTEEMVLFEKLLEGLPQHEFDEYLVVARNEQAWGALVEVLTSLYQNDFELFDRLMRRCVRASAGAAQDEGSYSALLSADEELMEEAAADREERRAAAGFIDPVVAKTLLQVLRRGNRSEILQEESTDPVVASYLGVLQGPTIQKEPRRLGGTAESFALRIAAGLAAEASGEDEIQSLPSPIPRSQFRLAMQELRDQQETIYFSRKRELGFLANVLLAGDAPKGRAMRPAAAATEVLETCERGYQILFGKNPEKAERTLVEELGMVKLFRLGIAGGN